MQCSDEMIEVVLTILSIGILKIRDDCVDLEQCKLEADHIHNLPHILVDRSRGALEYYLNIERPLYIADADEMHVATYKGYWDKLEKLIMGQ